MKKTQKKIIGFTGLTFVIAMTIVAASLPNPGASALSSVTDTITVRVIGSSPSAEIVGPSSGSTFVTADHPLGVNYEYVESLNIVLKHTSSDGTQTTRILYDGTVEQETGSFDFDFGTIASELGFGEYEISVVGVGVDGAPIPGDNVSFLYIPVIANAEQDKDTGKTYLNLDYEPYTEDGNGKVSSLEINVFDQNGNLVDALSPIIVNAPTTRIEIPFSEHDLESGKYRLDITALSINGDELYTPYITSADYQSEEWSGEDVIPDTNVPNTGGLFNSLNISKADYLITGALIFSIVGTSAFIFIAKRSKTTKRRK